MEEGRRIKVSVIIPCRNEEAFIADCIDSLLANDYPHEFIEILVVDGLSSDKTIDIVKQYSEKFSFIQLISNPKKIFPAAVNAGFNASSGDVIMIAGAHAVYDSKYISASVRLQFELGADNIGGVLITKGKNENFIGKLITATLSNPFGVGNSTFRTGSDKVCEVDTVFGGCYRREVFETIGLFNENLVSTSDMDYNSRLRRNGGKIFLSPEIKVEYYTRSTFSRFMKNNFRNGFWVIYPLRFVNTLPVSLRHLVPLGFFLGTAGLAFLGLLHFCFWWMLGGIGALYVLAAYYFSFSRAAKGGIAGAFIQPFFFVLLHYTYGIGSVFALVKLFYCRLFKPAIAKSS
ncbi:MAG: glycosyltransferase family 2 protein [Bacteroidota bacterium]